MSDLPPIHCPSPEDMPVLFQKGWNERDARQIAGLFAEDAEFVNVVGLWWHDRQAIWKAHDYGLRVIFSQSKLEIVRVNSKMLTEDIVLVHAKMRLTGQSENADVKQPRKRHNIFSFVMKCVDEGWICVSAHNTDVVPGSETNIIDEEGRFRSMSYRK